MEQESRLQNIENNYSRMADSMHRIAESTEKNTDMFTMLKNSLAGYIDDNGKFVVGYFQKWDDCEKRIATVEAVHVYDADNTKKRWRTIFSTTKDALLVVLSAVVLYFVRN